MRLAEIISEASSPAQQAAIAIAMKKAGKKPKSEDVAEGLNEFAPDGFGGDDGDGFDPDMAKMAHEEGFTKGVSLAMVATLERAMEIGHWHKRHGGMYKHYFAKGFKEGRLARIRHDNKQYDLNLQLNKDGSVSHGEQGVAEGETWAKHNHKRVGGMSKKSVSVYRREHPGSKIQTAVTTKPSKLKKGSKDAKRRKSFCARMKGMKKHRTSAKTAHDPNSNINKSLRRWHCESIEELHELVMLAEQFIQRNRK